MANGNNGSAIKGYLWAQWSDPVKVTFGVAGTIVGFSMPTKVQNSLSRMRVPANARGSMTVSKAGIGLYKIEATSLGRVPGSRAVYTKIVNNKGETMQMYKTTYDNKGNIPHVKDKMKN